MKDFRWKSLFAVTVLMFQVMACASGSDPANRAIQGNGPVPVTVTVEALRNADFVKGQAGSGWYYPGNPHPHIHLGAIGTGDSLPVTYISISLEGGGQNLKQCPPVDDVYQYNLATPGIDWAGHETEYKKALEGIGAAKNC